MRLRRLHLTRFGHFTDHVVDFGEKPPEGEPDFHVVYGLNEAGKTTFLNAVLRLLFRFPRQDVETYAFLHGSDLEIGAEIEDLPGRPNTVVRRIKAGNALLDAHGERLPDDFFAGALAGLDEAEYRTIFSLDRHSVIEGADDIRRAGGEAGRLLFAAHAGLSHLSSSLDAEDEAARALFLPGGKNQRVPQIKRALKTVEGQIRAAEVTPRDYDRLKREHDEAASARKACEDELRRLEADDRETRRRIEIRDLGRTIVALSTRLERDFAGYPDWPEEPDAPLLSTLAGKVAAADSAIAGRHEEIERAGAERAGLLLDEPVVEHAERIAALEPLRSTAEGTVNHYQRRFERERELEADMARRLATIVSQPDGRLDDRLVLTGEDIESLRAAQGQLGEAETRLTTAQEEEGLATARLDRLGEERSRDPTLAELEEATVDRLRLLGLADIAAAAERAETAIAHRRAAAEEALAGLALAGRAVTMVPETDWTPSAVRAAAERHAECIGEQRNAETALREIDAAIVEREHALATLEAGIGHEAVDAEASGTRRDVAWRHHRETLDATSADAFAEEMRRHDGVEAVRFERAADLGSVKAMRRDLEERRELRKAAAERAESALANVERAQTDHLETLEGLGLPAGTRREDLVSWLQQAETARREELRLFHEREAQAALLDRREEAGEEVRRLMPDLQGLPDARTLAVAAERLEAHGRATERRRDAERALEEAGRERDRRANERESAAAELADAQALWTETMRRRLPEDHGIADPRAALGVLAEISRKGQDWREVGHRVREMHRDGHAFVEALQRLAGRLSFPTAPFDEPTGDDGPQAFVGRVQAALDVERTLRQRLADAHHAQKRDAELVKTIASLRDQIGKTETERAEAAATIERLRERFPETIATEGMAELERVVSTAREATALRTEKAGKERALHEKLAGEESAPLDVAATFFEMDLEGALARLEGEIAETRERRNAASEAFGAARRNLESVSGDDTVAKLEAERAALSSDLTETVLDYARRRMGLSLARNAIDAYRRENRSEMMRVAGEAFARLTRGRYVDLTSRARDGKDVLVARRVEDDAVRRAEEMSEGTRMQLYFALRIAAYRARVASLPACPFLADDIFESFDDYRTEAACGEMRTLGLSGQSIYLTHHADVGVKALAASGGRDVVRFLPGVPEADRERLRPTG
ncbi:AAA family ATPase [Pararhizobium mangrovi]|nr:AAA family ATPase [Pararhizobium mangrovi]